MRIAINAEKLNYKEKTGVENYVKNLISGLAKLDDLPPLYLFTREKPPEDQPLPKGAKIIPLKKKYFYGLWQLPRALKAFDIDVFFEPARTLPLLFTPKASIFTVHDLAFLIFPEAYPASYRLSTTYLTSYSLKKATKIIAVSENTKRDLVKFFKAPPKKILVIPEAPALAENDSQPKFISKQTPYFLFIGRLEKRKNIVNLLRAFALLRKERSNNPPKLVLAGKSGFGFAEIEKELSKLGELKSEIILPGYIGEEEKSSLLKNALALVFPSLYEGFGLPILEAMAVGTPVITSKVGALEEIAKENALLVNPLKPLEIAGAMSKLLHTPSLRKELSRKGLSYAQNFSWQKTAEKTLSTLIEVDKFDKIDK